MNDKLILATASWTEHETDVHLGFRMAPAESDHRPKRSQNSVNTRLKKQFFATALIIAFSGALPAMASSDHERARDAMRQGLILPLDKILSIVSARQPGQILELELEDDRIDGKKIWVYEIKGITPDGRLFKLKVNAQNGDMIESRIRSSGTPRAKGHDTATQ